MSTKGGPSGIKRKRGGSVDGSKGLTKEESDIYELIKRSGDMGIWKGDIRRELNIPFKLVDNCSKSLQAKGFIKEVADIKSKGKKRLMAWEFEPSTDLTGGVWYNDGAFDADLIENLKRACAGILRRLKVATADEILHELDKSGGLKDFELKIEHVKHLLDNLCLDMKIMRVKSNGLGEFVKFPRNSECYMLRSGKKHVGAMASIPCGVCPRINQCSPHGIISPATCEYYTKWLLDF